MKSECAAVKFTHNSKCSSVTFPSSYFLLSRKGQEFDLVQECLNLFIPRPWVLAISEICSIFCFKLENLLSISRWVQTQTEGNRVLKQDHLNVVRGCQQLQEALSRLWLWHSIQIWEGLQIMTHNSSSDRHHAGMGQEWRDANGKLQYSANTSSNTFKNSFALCWCKSTARVFGWWAHFGFLLLLAVVSGGHYWQLPHSIKGRVWSGYSIWDSSSGNIPSSVRVAWKPPYRQLPRATPHSGSWNI